MVDHIEFHYNQRNRYNSHSLDHILHEHRNRYCHNYCHIYLLNEIQLNLIILDYVFFDNFNLIEISCYNRLHSSLISDRIRFDFDSDFWCLNSTFSNISAISWPPVLVVEEAGIPGENRPWASNW